MISIRITPAYTIGTMGSSRQPSTMKIQYSRPLPDAAPYPMKGGSRNRPMAAVSYSQLTVNFAPTISQERSGRGISVSTSRLM